MQVVLRFHINELNAAATGPTGLYTFHRQLHDVEFCCSLSQLVEHAVPALLQLKAAGKAADRTTVGLNIQSIMLYKVVKSCR